MIKTILTIDGMMCEHCQAHVVSAIKENFKVKKVTASHTDKTAEILSEENLNENDLAKAISDAGYTLTSIKTEEIKKKFLFF